MLSSATAVYVSATKVLRKCYELATIATNVFVIRTCDVRFLIFLNEIVDD